MRGNGLLGPPCLKVLWKLRNTQNKDEGGKKMKSKKEGKGRNGRGIKGQQMQAVDILFSFLFFFI